MSGPFVANTIQNRPKYSGLYTGVVVSQADELNQGRLEVKVPELLGESTIWANPLIPYGGLIIQVIPPKGQEVKIWFQGTVEDCYWLGGTTKSEQIKETDKVIIADDKGNFITWQRSTGIFNIKSQGQITLQSSSSIVLDAPTVLTTGKFIPGNGVSGYVSNMSCAVVANGIVEEIE